MIVVGANMVANDNYKKSENKLNLKGKKKLVF